MTKFSILDKSRAPSRNVFCEGLELVKAFLTAPLLRFFVEDRDGCVAIEAAALRLKNADDLHLAIVLAKPGVDRFLKPGLVAFPVEDRDLFHPRANFNLFCLWLSRIGGCGVGCVVATRDEEQKTEKRNWEHCLSDFHQNLLLGFGNVPSS